MKLLLEEREEAAQAGKAIRTAYLDGQIDAMHAICDWLDKIPEEWIHDWGLNASAEIRDHIMGETWRQSSPVRSEDKP